MNPLTDAAHEFWAYARVSCLSLAILGFLADYALKARIAKSFKILGLIRLFVMVTMLLVISFVPKLSYVFGPAFSLVLFFWDSLGAWYTYKLPGYQEWLESPVRQIGTVGRNTWLGRLLSARDTPLLADTPPPAWPLLSWKTATCAMASLFVFALLFGFARTMDKLALIYTLNAQTQAKSEIKTKQAVDTAIKQVTTAFTSQFTSVTVAQQQLSQEFRTGTKALTTLVGVNGRKVDVASKAAGKAAKAAAVAAQRGRPLIIVQPAPIQTVSPLLVSPDKVKPLPKPAPLKTRQGKYGFAEGEADSTIYARNYYSH